MVRPILEYSSTVWSLFTKKNITMIESVQRRAARFVTSNYQQISSVTSIYAIETWLAFSGTAQKDRKSDHSIQDTVLHNKVAISLDRYRVPSSTVTRGHSQQVAARLDAYIPLLIFPMIHC